MAAADASRGLTAINITPMVDIMLVLLVIFMVTTSSVSQLEGLDVDRPDAATGSAMQTQTEVVLTCRPGGAVEVDGVPMAGLEDAAAAVEARLAQFGELAGVIACDQAADVGALVQLLDLLRAAGVRRYAIATEQPE